MDWEQRMAERTAAKRESAITPTREEAEAKRIAYCAECSEVRLDGPHGYRVFRTCDHTCQHSHHADEVWMAG